MSDEVTFSRKAREFLVAIEGDDGAAAIEALGDLGVLCLQEQARRARAYYYHHEWTAPVDGPPIKGSRNE